MKTLFVPTDLSSHSLVALRYALELIKVSDVDRLIYFHINPQPITQEIPVLYMDDLQKVNEEIADHLKHELKECMLKAGISRPIITDVMVTTDVGPITAIPEFAHKHKSDLIVMGTHGNTGLDRLIFGSVTAGVLENSKTPVLTIPKHFTFQPIKKIAFASSFTSFTLEIKAVLKFCKALHAKLDVIHVDDGLLSEKLIKHARRVIKEIDDLNIELHIVQGNLEIKLIETLKKEVSKLDPQWLVMVPKKTEWYEKFFLSSKSIEVANHYNRPLLILPFNN